MSTDIVTDSHLHGMCTEVELSNVRDQPSSEGRKRKSNPSCVPRHLRDSHFGSAEELGHGVGYQYSHNEEDGVSAQDYLGVEREYYQPVDRGFEEKIAARLKLIRQKLKSAKE